MYKNIKDFVEKLKMNVRVIAIIRYGSKTIDDIRKDSDFDLCIILKDYHLNIESIHFKIANIPIDVNLRGYNDLLLDEPISDYDLSILEGEILFDKSGIISRMLAKSKEKWCKKEDEVKEMSLNEINFERFTLKHSLDVIKNNTNLDEVFSNYSINNSIINIIKSYYKINQLNFNNDRDAIEYIKNRDKDIYLYIKDFYNADDYQNKLKILGKILELVFDSKLNVWADDDMVFLARDRETPVLSEEKEEVIKLLEIK